MTRWSLFRPPGGCNDANIIVFPEEKEPSKYKDRKKWQKASLDGNIQLDKKQAAHPLAAHFWLSLWKETCNMYKCGSENKVYTKDKSNITIGDPGSFRLESKEQIMHIYILLMYFYTFIPLCMVFVIDCNMTIIFLWIEFSPIVEIIIYLFISDSKNVISNLKTYFIFSLYKNKK